MNKKIITPIITPQEQANNIFDIYFKIITDINPMASIEIRRSFAKKCAIACVNEILKLKMINAMGRDIKYSEGNFWGKVLNYLQYKMDKKIVDQGNIIN